MGIFVMRRWLIALFVLAACRPSGRPPVGPSVQDDAGRTVTLAAPARRIVSLLPSFTELVFAMGAGDRLVGRTAWCDYPPAALAVPSVGDGMPPNVEAVAARRPDLVLLYHSGTNLTAGQQLAGLGVPVALLHLDRLEDLGPAARRIGRLTGRVAQAESLAAAMDSLAAAKPLAPNPQSLVFVVWDNPPIVIGHGSYLDRLAALAGARNVFADVAAPSAQVSLETIAARDPDWIAVLSDSSGPPAFAARREWRAVRAVREGRFLNLPGSLFGRPGPRSSQAVAELRARLEAAP
ncbi:MAG TPA: helical backbone metal receptor [Gemmatimonadales bacterium]|jgi:ABC-type Fe3+-hydroxamate transport system substrate-binding protein|nr:helical backbone metal receptor [Gemmatimonadales bacterium]